MRPDGTSEGTLGDPELDAQGAADAEDLMWTESSEVRGDLFIDVTAPPIRGSSSSAPSSTPPHLSALATVAGWRAYVVDPRARFATPERFPDALGVVAGLAGGGLRAARRARQGDVHRDPHARSQARRRDAAHRAAAPTSPYIGAMGSKRAQADRRERLHAAGVTDEDSARISAPVGLDLGATSARETALSIMAELRGGAPRARRRAAVPVQGRRTHPRRRRRDVAAARRRRRRG